MDKPKLAWYENNKDFTDPVEPYLMEFFEVEVFGNPGKAKSGIMNFKPEIVLFDYRMPEISGIDMFNILKKEGLSFVTIFYTIWANDDAAKKKIKDAGINEEFIIDKHVESESFAKIVFELFKKFKKNEGAF